jgi:hypothetical protein
MIKKTHLHKTNRKYYPTKIAKNTKHSVLMLANICFHCIYSRVIPLACYAILRNMTSCYGAQFLTVSSSHLKIRMRKTKEQNRREIRVLRTKVSL